jgi:hypothetical protein
MILAERSSLFNAESSRGQTISIFILFIKNAAPDFSNAASKMSNQSPNAKTWLRHEFD